MSHVHLLIICFHHCWGIAIKQNILVVFTSCWHPLFVFNLQYLVAWRKLATSGPSLFWMLTEGLSDMSHCENCCCYILWILCTTCCNGNCGFLASFFSWPSLFSKGNALKSSKQPSCLTSSAKCSKLWTLYIHQYFSGVQCFCIPYESGQQTASIFTVNCF